MFKFRRSSICSSNKPEVEIFTDSDSGGGGTSPTPSPVGAIAGRVGTVQIHTVIHPKGDSSVKKSVDSSRPFTPRRSEEKKSGEPTRDSVSVNSSSTNSSKDSTPTMTNKWSFNGEKLKNNFKNSFIGHVMCDRKRKERQESISQGQEKKVIRSLSDDEGLNETEKIKDMKRTLSHDDFNRKREYDFDGIGEQRATEGVTSGGNVSKGEKPEPNPSVLIDQPTTNTMRKYTGTYEPELQRQLERSVNYSASPSPSLKGSRKGHRRRHRSSRHDSISSNADAQAENEEGAEEEEEEAESPLTESSSSESTEETVNGIPLVKVEDSSSGRKEEFELDFSKMHHQVETSQPISFLESISGPGADQVMLSPRSGFLIKDAIDLPPSPPMQQIQLDPPLSRQSLLGENESSTKINSLTRLITNLKKKVKAVEEEYEKMFGYKPSHADKLNNRDMRKYLVQIAKANRELKLLKEDPAAVQEANLMASGKKQEAPQHPRGSLEYLSTLTETVKEIQGTLGHKRRITGRPDDPEKMSTIELAEEKSAMQRQLILLERKHGRPASRQEREIVRPLYERYRSVKKFSVRIPSSVKDSGVDLVPIMEHETLEFPEIEEEEEEESANPPACSVVEIKKGFGFGSPKFRKPVVTILEDTDDMDLEIIDDRGVQNESFNSMNLYELERRQKQAKEHKRRLRGVLRRFESDFQEATGRPPFKDEKYASPDLESHYHEYKRAKATVRLLDVLISKKRYSPGLKQAITKTPTPAHE